MDQHATKPNFAFIEFASSSSCDAALQKGLTFLGGRLLNVSKRKQRDREVNDRPSDAQAKILRQVHFYLSDRNLATDIFLASKLAENNDKMVDIELIAGFPKMRQLVADVQALKLAVAQSGLLYLSEDGTMIGRKQDLKISGSQPNTGFQETQQYQCNGHHELKRKRES